mmetsp:Transcript_35693/g.112638  ORF Transcript_35693/g.112638 Transcript_35693/m.112638 type:complete len:91 (-) Transcript_35693:203-475(-)
MVGRYPYVEPTHRTSTVAQGEAQLDSILDAGVSAFVSMQQELPDQELIPPEGKDGWMAYHGPVMKNWLAGASRRCVQCSRGPRRQVLGCP